MTVCALLKRSEVGGSARTRQTRCFTQRTGIEAPLLATSQPNCGQPAPYPSCANAIYKPPARTIKRNNAAENRKIAP